MAKGMTANGERELHELLDREAIRDVVLRYARGIDRRDYEAVAACFVPRAHTDYGPLFAGEVEGLMERIRHGLAAYGTTMHFVANHLAEVDGDEARCETYCLAHHRPAAGDRRNDLLVIGLRYLDVMARHDGAWRIARRVVAFDWRRLEAGVLAPSR